MVTAARPMMPALVSDFLAPAAAPEPALAPNLRVALVHDWLLGMRGGERVLEALLPLFPSAEIYTLFYDPAGVSDEINRRAVRPSNLARLPGVRRYYRGLLPALPSAIERARIAPGTDLVISISHCVAHGIEPPSGSERLNYCLSPMRYLYDQRGAYAAGGAPVSARMLAMIEGRLAAWDRAAALRCGNYWSISRTVAERVARIYGLASRVVYPPVRTEYFTPAEDPASSDAPYLIVSSLVPYKRVDLAIRAANELGKQLVVVGAGPEEGALRRLAGPSVRFAGWVSDAELREHYRASAALIFPGEEDFGIAPLEAMACGKPVLALRAGGLAETLAEGVAGAFFEAPNPAALAAAWEKFAPAAYDPAAIRERAERFSTARFRREFAAGLREQFAA